MQNLGILANIYKIYCNLEIFANISKNNISVISIIESMKEMNEFFAKDNKIEELSPLKDLVNLELLDL